MTKKTLKSKSREFFDALVFAAVVAMFLKIFFIEAYRIPTGSMENTLLVGDFLLVNKFIYGATTPRNIPFTDIRIPYFRLPSLREPQQGDVVVFDFPGNRDEIQSPEVVNYIKRLIAGPGDTLQIINKVVSVNGRVFPNPKYAVFSPTIMKPEMVEPNLFPRGCGWNEDNYGPLRIPKKGDVIPISKENLDKWKIFIEREGHTVGVSDNGVLIDGKPETQYIVDDDYYFMMGDNRNNSADSRYWGFMPRRNVVGEALIIYWSWDPAIPFSDLFKLVNTIRWNRVGMLIK